MFTQQLFFKNRGILNEEGFILFVRKNAIIILIPKFGLEGTVFFENKDKPGPRLSFDSEVFAKLHSSSATFKMLQFCDRRKTRFYE